MSQWLPLIASILLAVIPVAIWLQLIHREGEERGLYIKTFLTGTFAVVPPFLIILLFERFPQLDIYSTIGRTVTEVALAALLTNVVVGIIEEIAKHAIVRVIDKRHPEYIQTIGTALKLSICAGLGFSFAENIFYFYNIWVNPDYTFADLFSSFVFRSIFTMCLHMIASGIFGYYFGIGKFAADITEHARWEGKHMVIARWISKLTGKMTFQVVREMKNLKGLLIAMTVHAVFNASLDLQHKLPSILIAVVSAIYIIYLLQTKSGHLMFSIVKRKASTMAARDEDVVLELLGMWAKEGRYEEVAKICDNLLARDPDNNVVKLFKAKASDNQELKRVYTSLKAVFEKEAAMPSTAKTPGAISFNIEDEKTILEVMDMFYKQGNYKQVLDVANKLLARNPSSEGAKVLLSKAMDREKMKRVFDSLSMLFKE